MLYEQGQVEHVVHDRVQVARLGTAGCERCAEGRGCGGGLLGRLLGDRLYRVTARATTQVPKPGDRVLIGIPESGLLAAAALVYGLPLLGLLFFVALGGVVFDSDNLAIVGGLFGLAGGFLAIRWLAHSTRISRRLQPRVLNILDSSESEPLL